MEEAPGDAPTMGAIGDGTGGCRVEEALGDAATIGAGGADMAACGRGGRFAWKADFGSLRSVLSSKVSEEAGMACRSGLLSRRSSASTTVFSSKSGR